MTWRQNSLGPGDQTVLVVSLCAAPSRWLTGQLVPLKSKSWCEMDRDFPKLLFDISEALVADELEALKFLSLDYIPRRKLEAIREPKAFFDVLQEKGMLEAGNLSFLRELLYRIHRMDLLAAQLGCSRQEMDRELRIPGRAQVSPYRQLLYGIAEDLTTDDCTSMKFLLQEQIPKNKLQENASLLKVLLEMEKKGIIKEDDLAMLKDILKKIRPDVKKKIDAYEEKKQEEDSEEKLHHPVPEHPAEQGEEQQTERPFVGSYKMKNNPHGYCVILNNYSFKNLSQRREGTQKDGEAVKEVFTWLQFETVEHMDLEAKQIRAKVEEYSKKDHSNMDCFVCFILSHGEKDKIKGIDDELACQGSVGHPAVPLQEDGSGHLETDAVPQTSIPDQADILVGMATVEDYECYRDIKTGSVYVQCLCEKMKSLCPLRKDLVTILTAVNNEVSSRVFKASKQMPKITSTLRKQLIFQIPQCPSTEK
ncbi:caspase-8-like isoform X2 [Caloenas nicobarica]|uniref:caspase-8-like isoform X2 n=1 Tax=Caloenas nicobarica TaxID=187106 RepID=UPI0032B7449C